MCTGTPLFIVLREEEKAKIELSKKKKVLCLNSLSEREEIFIKGIGVASALLILTPS
jgi:hypothetical protein